MPHDANALQLLQYKRQPPQAPPTAQAPPAHRPPPSQSQPFDHQLTPSPKMDVYDVRWDTGALGLRFTPNENDDPVVCQIMDTASEAVKRSRVAVGDVVVAVQAHAGGAPMAPITSLQEMVQVFQHEELPITVRFRSRAHEAPQAIEIVDIARSYTYTWPPGQPLGVSLAMDPCSLHTIITSIDHDRISPDFLPLEPAPGDILVSVRDLERKADLDSLRFDKVVATLQSFPRPCKLTFARLHEDVASPTSGERRRSASGQRRPSGANATATTSASLPAMEAPTTMQPPRSPAHGHAPTQQQAPFAVPPPPTAPARQPMRRPAPLMKRQSFAVGESKRPPQQQQLHAQLDPKEEARKKAQHDARFYKIVYGGGHIGLVLNDANLELKGKPKKNGYYAIIKKLPKKKTLEGLDQASEGDELIAIGMRDLQHVPFDEVQHELASIRTPTPLVFQRKPQSTGSVGASLVDGLLLFLI